MWWWIGFVFAAMAVTIVVLGWLSARQRIKRDIEWFNQEHPRRFTMSSMDSRLTELPAETKDERDSRIHYERMQQLYPVWYEGDLGGMFSIDVFSNMKQAEEDLALFIEDGLPARIIKVTVVDGQPVATWVSDRTPEA